MGFHSPQNWLRYDGDDIAMCYGFQYKIVVQQEQS